MTGRLPPAPDAVVHFAAVPRVVIKPDNETFLIDTIGTDNVVEAAEGSRVKKVVIAPSETTYGVCFAEGDKDFQSFPRRRILTAPNELPRPVDASQREDRAPSRCDRTSTSTRCGSAT